MSVLTTYSKAASLSLRLQHSSAQASHHDRRSRNIARMTSALSHSPDRAALLRAAGAALGSDDLEVDRLGGHLFRTYRLQAHDGSFCAMRCKPVQSIRLLRLEEDCLAVEAAALAVLARCRLPQAPRLLDMQTSDKTLGTSYSISGPFTGSILSHLDQPLSGSRKRALDRSMGRYIRRLASIEGQSFGRLSCPGISTWSACFASLFQSLLHDAEDSMVSLPYMDIREQIVRHRSSLDKITTPRLTLIEAAHEENIVIDTRTTEVASLLDYVTAIWGDPFLCDCLYAPSEAFTEGFGESVGGDGDADRRIRQLLYILFHSVLAITRQCLRPQAGESDQEARRSLNIALRYLGDVAAT